MKTQSSPQPLVEYWKRLKPEQKKALADELKTTVGYLRRVFLYGKQAGGPMARKLGAHTTLTAADFRPDIFGELAA